jgi:acetyl esterase
VRRRSDHLAANPGDPASGDPVACLDQVVQAGAASMPVRVYRAACAAESAPIVFHLHGGAFAGGSLDTGHTVAKLLAEAGAVVISADYPLAPEHSFPAALESVHRIMHRVYAERARWAHKRSSIFVAGEEAGGNLAAGLALLTRDQHGPPLAGQILLSPMLDPRMATCSFRQAEAGSPGCQWADGWHHYLGSPANAAHPYASPLGSSRLGGVAPALVLTAEDDPMRDESLSYARRLRESGVAVDQHVLSAPTDWPCAFARPVGASEDWATTVRNLFSAFFADTLGLLNFRPSLHLNHA